MSSVDVRAAATSCRAFDSAFLPRQNQTRGRWLIIDRAHDEELSLPPVELYGLGEAYFVKDGNHRVSVARGRGQEFVDANVIPAGRARSLAERPAYRRAGLT